MKYIKLGDKALTFHDPTNGLNLSAGEVLKVKDSQLQTKKTKEALKGGHLVYTGEDEFNKYEELKANEVPVVEKNFDKVLERKNKALETENTQLRATVEALTTENQELRSKLSVDAGTTESVLDELSQEELIEYMENGEFEDKDLKKAKKIKDRDELQNFIEKLEGKETDDNE